MNIDELKAHSSKPVWQRLRRIYQATNVIIVLLMAILIGVLIYHNPYCEPVPNLDWNENSIIYETNKICSSDSCDSFNNITYLKTINSNILIVTGLNLNETIDILKANNIRIVINYTPSYNDKDNATLQSLIDLGVDGFNLINAQIQPDSKDSLSNLISFILDYNKNNSNKKKTFLLTSEQASLLGNSSEHASAVTKFNSLSSSFNDLDLTKLTQANWMVDSNDPLKLALSVFLRGSKILNVDKLYENGVIYDQLSKITELKRKFKTLEYGHIDLNSNQSLVIVRRHFIGDTTAILIVNYDAEKTYELKLVFSLFGLKDKSLDVDYFYALKSVADKDKLASLTKISVDKNGDCVPNDLVLPAQSSLVISWPYVPPDF